MSLDVTYKGVNKTFGEDSKTPVKALSDVSFTIKSGELFCLLGPSGCGKTTLLRSTAGLETITGGKIMYGDKDISSIPPFRRNIGMVFQSFALYPHMSIFENVAYGLRIRKIPEKQIIEKVTNVMELVGLQEELKRNPSPTGLSGGQQQRVAIARALVYDPDILLLDEPLANLDAKLRRYMRAEIRRIQKATNITTIFVTHDQEEAMAVGDRLAVLQKGVVKQIGTSDELYNKPNSSFVANFIGKMNFLNCEITEVKTNNDCAVKINNTDIKFDILKDKSHIKSPKKNERAIIGARPEQLLVAKAPSSDAIKGKVLIIQHLGQFIRYEVQVDSKIAIQTFEIDMPRLIEGVKEQDSVYVSLKKEFASLYKIPEVK